MEIGEWLIERGMDPDARSAIDAEGFRRLHCAILDRRLTAQLLGQLRQGQPDEARFTRLLLDRRADPNVRASIRQRLEQRHGGGPLREYRDVTPLGCGEQFAAKIFVSHESLRLIEARGGGR